MCLAACAVVDGSAYATSEVARNGNEGKQRLVLIPALMAAVLIECEGQENHWRSVRASLMRFVARLFERVLPLSQLVPLSRDWGSALT